MRSDLLNLYQKRNQETLPLHSQYAAHRARVMQLIEATVKDLTTNESTGNTTSACSSIVLLGFGNGHDVDLHALAQWFRTLHLVDVDREAVESCVIRADLGNSHPKIHAPTDVAEPLLSLTSEDFELTTDQQDHYLNVLQHLSADNALVEIPEADVVVSLNIFPQIADSLQQIIPQNHGAFSNAIKAVRIGHLRRMLNMLRPGGVAIFISDIASSEFAPELADATNDSIAEMLPKLIQQEQFLNFVAPAVILNDLNLLSRTNAGPDTIHTLDPWILDSEPHKQAVYAVRIQRKIPEENDHQPEHIAKEHA